MLLNRKMRQRGKINFNLHIIAVFASTFVVVFRTYFDLIAAIVE